MPPSPSSHRYAALDGLRGIAALSVVAYHAGVGLKLGWLAPRGYLAVDFFFVLSGFVLARAYGERLTTRRMSASELLRKRYFRLWPIACAGTVLGIVLSWPAAASAPTVAVAGLLMLPNIWRRDLTVYPYNPPHWSLWHEFVSNCAYGIVAPRLTNPILVGWIVLAGGFLAFDVLSTGSGDDLWLSRVAYSFAVGVGLHRLRPATFRISFFVLVAVFIAAVAAGGPGRVDLALILLLFPSIIWVGASAKVGTRMATVCAYSGRISYPLYAWHMPILLRLIGR